MELYFRAIELAAKVEDYLKTDTAKDFGLDTTNARYYLISGFALRSTLVGSLEDYYGLPVSKLPYRPKDDELKEIHGQLSKAVSGLDDGETARDRIFKGSELKNIFFESILSANKTDKSHARTQVK